MKKIKEVNKNRLDGKLYEVFDRHCHECIPDIQNRSGVHSWETQGPEAPQIESLLQRIYPETSIKAHHAQPTGKTKTQQSGTDQRVTSNPSQRTYNIVDKHIGALICTIFSSQSSKIKHTTPYQTRMLHKFVAHPTEENLDKLFTDYVEVEVQKPQSPLSKMIENDILAQKIPQ